MKETKYNIPVYEDEDIADLKEYSEKMAEAIKTQVDKFGNPLVFKGIVPTLTDLQAITEATNGEIYAVVQENKNYIWNGTEWKIYSDNSESINTTSDIIVSPTEPQTDRRKVWFQTKGKNLFDKSNILRGYLNENGTISNNNEEYFVSEFIKVEPNTKYFCGQTGSKRGKFYDSSKEVINTSFNFSTIENGVCFTTTDETYFIRVTVTAEHINNLQIEKGEGATQFEEYINPTIHIKNDNGEYEEFVRKEEERIDIINEMEYATNEYIDGNRIYRKRMLLGNGPGSSLTKTYPIGVQGFNIIKTNLCLKQNALYIPLPIASPDTGAIVNYYIDGTNLIIQTGRDRSSFLVRAEIYYIK